MNNLATESDVLRNKNEKSLNNSFGFCCGTIFGFVQERNGFSGHRDSTNQ